MKVVMLKSVKHIGHAGSVVEVADGHALNMLIPRKMAVLATPAALKQAERIKKQTADKKDLDQKLVLERLSALAEEKIVFVKKANEKGHLYDAVDAREIAEKAGLPEDAISLEKPIKEIGVFDVPVSYHEAFGKISISVEAE